MANFPPSGPVTLQKVIASYLYLQYNDDDDLAAFVSAFNQLAQNYVDTLNDLNLPVYPLVTGDLLDWVGQGLYGFTRPVLPLAPAEKIGPLNTWALNTWALNTYTNALPRFVLRPGPPIGTFSIGESVVGGSLELVPNRYVTNDDTYQRAITWHFYKGDGRVFNIRWLKRRIQRFLDGISGTDPGVSSTYLISVTFGVGNQVNINIARPVVAVTGGAILNRMGLNTTYPNELTSHNSVQPPVPEAPIFKAAVDAGVLELPFQFTWVVSI